jgi:arsenate reductase
MKVLVLCTGNSCRSQMAEGFLRAALGGNDLVASAGIEPHGLNPRAVEVMREVGIDISSHTSNDINRYLNHSFDYVITVCDNAAKRCPTFPGSGIRLHWPFDDPAQVTGSDDHILAEFRRVRDEIHRKIDEWLDTRDKQ